MKATQGSIDGRDGRGPLVRSTDHEDLRLWAVQQLAEGYSENTVRARMSVLRQICAEADVEPRALESEHLIQYLSRRDLAAWSRRKYVEHVRAFGRWAGMDPIPGDDVRVPGQPRGVPKPVTEDQLQRLLGVAAPRTRSFVLLAAYAGLRSFEIAKVCGADLEDATGEAPRLRVRGKGGRLDVLPVPDVLLEDLRRLREAAGDGPLFPGLTSGAVQQAFNIAAKNAGLKVSIHQLRHRYGTALYAASKDLLLVQRMMRHSSPTTTAGYAHVDQHEGGVIAGALPGASLTRGPSPEAAPVAVAAPSDVATLQATVEALMTMVSSLMASSAAGTDSSEPTVLTSTGPLDGDRDEHSPWQPLTDDPRGWDRSPVSFDGDDLLAAVAVLTTFDVNSRLRRLVALGLDFGVIDIADAMTLPHEGLSLRLEAAVSQGDMPAPRPLPAPAPSRDGPSIVDTWTAVGALPADLRDPASAALGQGVATVDLLRWLDHDGLREFLSDSIRNGRLVNELHQEDPEVFPAWQLPV